MSSIGHQHQLPFANHDNHDRHVRHQHKEENQRPRAAGVDALQCAIPAKK